jgi:PST family polysaccharide transporter
MVVSIFLFFKMFRSGGLLDATIQKEEINHQQISKLFWINMGFGFVLTFIFIALIPLMNLFYKDSRITTVALFISLDFVLAGFSAQHRALLKRNFEFYKTAAMEITATTLSYSAAIIMALHGWGYWALVTRHVAYPIFETIGAWMLCGWRPGLPRRGTDVTSMLKFGMHMLGNFSINYFTNNLDKVLVGMRYGAQMTGYYSRAYYLFMAPAQQMTYPMTGVAVATLSRLSNEPERFRRFYINAVGMIAFIGFPISGILTLFSNDFILLLLGPQWKLAAEIFSVFGLGIGIQMIYGTNAWIHISLGKTERWLRWNLFGTTMTMGAYLVGMHYGPVGVASAYTATLFLLAGPTLWYAGRPIGLTITLIISKIWKYVAATVLSGLGSWFLLFREHDVATYYTHLNVVFRLMIGSITFLSLDMLALSILFGGLAPFRQFISVLNELRPQRRDFR